MHLKQAAGGQTYAQVSSQALQQPGDARLAGQVQTLFRGETLRGLLNAYAFWKVGQIALWAAVASLVLAGVMGVLGVLGFWHLRRVSPAQQLLGRTVDPQRTGLPA